MSTWSAHSWLQSIVCDQNWVTWSCTQDFWWCYFYWAPFNHSDRPFIRKWSTWLLRYLRVRLGALTAPIPDLYRNHGIAATLAIRHRGRKDWGTRWCPVSRSRTICSHGSSKLILTWLFDYHWSLFTTVSCHLNHFTGSDLTATFSILAVASCHTVFRKLSLSSANSHPH
jgi:hypothetical protein